MHSETIELSARLTAVASLVPDGMRIADIGTDHAYLPIRLVSERRIPGAIAMDVNEGPLQIARGHIRSCNLEDQILTRLSDGLRNLKPGEVACAVIAGMGGPLIRRILEQDRETAHQLQAAVLQPQSDVPALRRFLREDGWRICRERMIEERGKFYPMMLVVPGETSAAEGAAGELGDLFGPCLLAERDPVLRRYLMKRRDLCRTILSRLSSDGPQAQQLRYLEVAQELMNIRMALKMMET